MLPLSEIYLQELTDGFRAERVIRDWMDFYNQRRPHTALDGRTPDIAYWLGRETEQPDWQARSVA